MPPTEVSSSRDRLSLDFKSRHRRVIHRSLARTWIVDSFLCLLHPSIMLCVVDNCNFYTFIRSRSCRDHIMLWLHIICNCWCDHIGCCNDLCIVTTLIAAIDHCIDCYNDRCIDQCIDHCISCIDCYIDRCIDCCNWSLHWSEIIAALIAALITALIIALQSICCIDHCNDRIDCCIDRCHNHIAVDWILITSISIWTKSLHWLLHQCFNCIELWLHKCSDSRHRSNHYNHIMLWSHYFNYIMMAPSWNIVIDHTVTINWCRCLECTNSFELWLCDLNVGWVMWMIECMRWRCGKIWCCLQSSNQSNVRLNYLCGCHPNCSYNNWNLGILRSIMEIVIIRVITTMSC